MAETRILRYLEVIVYSDITSNFYFNSIYGKSYISKGPKVVLVLEKVIITFISYIFYSLLYSNSLYLN